MIINHNLMAMNAHRQLAVNQTSASKNMEKLSSGLRINRAGDDAAGLAISEKMRGQIRGLRQAMRNAQDAISLIQTAEGALNETHAILQRMRELAVQSASDTNTGVDREEIQKEMDQLAIELTRIANNTEFNTQTLMNGGIQDGALGELGFHIGANEGQYITLSIGAMDAHSLGVARDIMQAELTNAIQVTGVSVGTTTGSAIVDKAQIQVSAQLVSGSAATAAAKVADQTAVLNTKYADLSGDLILNGVTVTLTQVKELDGSGQGTPITIDALVNALQADIDAAFGTSSFTVSESSGVLTITNNTEGASSVVDLTGSGAIAGADGLGFTSLGAVTGTDATDDTLTVTFSDGTDSVDVLGVALDATSVSGTGVFAGLTLTLDGSLDADLAATIDITCVRSSAAVFSNGAKDADAVAAAGIDVSSRTSADSAVTIIQNAIDRVSAERSKLGAYQNRLEHTISNLGTSAENLQAAESRIRDLDMAEEIMAFTKNNILQQAATAMLAQANMAPQSVLQLLG
jgi:flagellin